jgi:hypothetical protein
MSSKLSAKKSTSLTVYACPANFAKLPFMSSKLPVKIDLPCMLAQQICNWQTAFYELKITNPFALYSTHITKQHSAPDPVSPYYRH